MAIEQQGHMVGVIGAGRFGTAIANLLTPNRDVLLYCRNAEQAQKIERERKNAGVVIPSNVNITNDLPSVAKNCTLIFPIVPSSNFRKMMQQLGPHLHPYHILIHGTKGFDLKPGSKMDPTANLTRNDISTMSEIIREESAVIRVGCLSGPNLAKEILAGQPTATVVASRFHEVIRTGIDALSSEQFQVFGSTDIIGAELAGALKNIIALGSGVLWGKGFGKNLQAMLITRGLMEMVYFGKAMGAESKAFLGTAGIGDLVATATSKDSRNFTFGYRLGQGESIKDIENTMEELAEGVRTLNIAHQLAKYYKLHVPITEMLYKIFFEEKDIDQAIHYLMSYPYDVDVDFL